MAYSDPVNSTASGITLVDRLLWGSQWSDGSPATISLAVHIAGMAGKETFDFGGDTVAAKTASAEVAAFRLAMQLIGNVCNIDFIEVGGQDEADIIVGTVNDADAGGDLGVAVPPGEDVGPLSGQQGAVIVNHDAYHSTDYSSLAQGGYDFISFIHELGHAIGLKHPHDRGGGSYPRFPGVTSAFGDYGDFDLNQGVYTMMSYNDGFRTGPLGVPKLGKMPGYGWEGTPMALDIAALQHMYGANLAYHTGDDVYVLPSAKAAGNFYSCIWDAGGTDEIVAGNGRDCTINLNAASLQVERDGGGAISAHAGIFGGFTIANGVVIENASGRSGNDTLTGNAAANVLAGRGGADRLSGGRGADTLSGGAGDDIFVFRSKADSLRPAADVITDFKAGDVIDLSGIDADGAGSRDSFLFIGDDAFGGIAGELRAFHRAAEDATWILGDINGDARADFKIVLAGNVALTQADFIL